MIVVPASIVILARTIASTDDFADAASVFAVVVVIVIVIFDKEQNILSLLPSSTFPISLISRIDASKIASNSTQLGAGLR